MLRTSWPCAVTTSGARDAAAATSPAGTRKWASPCAGSARLQRGGSRGKPGFPRVLEARLGTLGVVRSVEAAQGAADLSDRAAEAEGLAHRDEQVCVTLGRDSNRGQRRGTSLA